MLCNVLNIRLLNQNVDENDMIWLFSYSGLPLQRGPICHKITYSTQWQWHSLVENVSSQKTPLRVRYLVPLMKIL